MRDFLNAILDFIGVESLTDEEYDSLGVSAQVYNKTNYTALKGVLEDREEVSDTLDRLKYFFLAKGVAITTDAKTPKSNILIGLSLSGSSITATTEDDEDEGDMAVEGTEILSTGEEAGLVLKTNGDGGAEWGSVAGNGDVVGPESSSNNRMALFGDSTGKLLKQAAAITAARALISDANGVPTHASVTAAELAFVSGVTSAIQTQLNAKQASGSYATSTDLTNGLAAKQDTGDYLTALTGDVTASGPGSASATISNAAVIAKVLTGFTSGAGEVAATDTILQAFQKIVANIALKADSSALSAKADAANPTFTGSVTFGNYKMHPAIHDAGAPSTNALEVDWTDASAQLIDLDDDLSSFTLSNPQQGGVYLLKIECTVGDEAITWPGSVDFGEHGEPPTDDAEAGEIFLVNLIWDTDTYFGSWQRGYGL